MYICRVLLMTRYPILLLLGLFLWLGSGPLIAQSATDPEQLKTALEAATTNKERYGLYFQLATQLTKDRSDEAPAYAEKAYNTAKILRDKQLMADAAWLTAEAYDQIRNTGKTEYWQKTTMTDAMGANDGALLLRAVKKRAMVASRAQKYQRAATIYEEALDYFTEGGESNISTVRASNEIARSKLEAERKALEKQRAKLADELEILKEEQEVLEDENDQLLTDRDKKIKELAQREVALNEVTEAKAEVEDRMAIVRQDVDKLTKEAMAQELTAKRAEEELRIKEAQAQEAELRATQAELASAQNEQHRNYAFGVGIILLLLSALLYYRFVSKRKAANALAASNTDLVDARKKSDDLLLNILPANIADELKATGSAKAKKFDDTTILFSDFVNFTNISEQLGPEELVRELDVCFQAFDDILDDYADVEKIKTIGDAYMVASGLDNRKSVPANIIRAAIRMQQFLQERGQHRKSRGLPFFEARIGLHTGPVVAGVVGKKKFAYDVWGDTVNTAARVETESEPGKVNVSETTYRLIKYQFTCDYRGKVQAKNKGYLDMYFVKGEL